MKVYCELAGEHGCIGVIPDPETELILTGTVVHTEPEAYRDLPLARVLAEECDLHFFFGASTEPPFYTVPKTEVFARDSRGGYFLTTGDTALDWSAPRHSDATAWFRWAGVWRRWAETGGRPWFPAMRSSFFRIAPPPWSATIFGLFSSLWRNTHDQ